MIIGRSHTFTTDSDKKYFSEYFLDQGKIKDLYFLDYNKRGYYCGQYQYYCSQHEFNHGHKTAFKPLRILLEYTMSVTNPIILLTDGTRGIVINFYELSSVVIKPQFLSEINNIIIDGYKKMLSDSSTNNIYHFFLNNVMNNVCKIKIDNFLLYDVHIIKWFQLYTNFFIEINNSDGLYNIIPEIHDVRGVKITLSRNISSRICSMIDTQYNIFNNCDFTFGTNDKKYFMHCGPNHKVIIDIYDLQYYNESIFSDCIKNIINGENMTLDIKFMDNLTQVQVRDCNLVNSIETIDTITIDLFLYKTYEHEENMLMILLSEFFIKYVYISISSTQIKTGKNIKNILSSIDFKNKFIENYKCCRYTISAYYTSEYLGRDECYIKYPMYISETLKRNTELLENKRFVHVKCIDNQLNH